MESIKKVNSILANRDIIKEYVTSDYTYSARTNKFYPKQTVKIIDYHIKRRPVIHSKEYMEEAWKPRQVRRSLKERVKTLWQDFKRGRSIRKHDDQAPPVSDGYEWYAEFNVVDNRAAPRWRAKWVVEADSLEVAGLDQYTHGYSWSGDTYQFHSLDNVGVPRTRIKAKGI